jgi:hypothetical protein
MLTFKSKLWIGKIFLISIFFIVTFNLASCGNGGGSTSRPVADTQDLPNIILTLPNDSVIYSLPLSFSTNSTTNTTGTIGILGPISNNSYHLSFTINSLTKTNLPIITTTPTNCVLTTSNNTENFCTITVNPNNAAVGTYNIIPVLTSIDDNTPISIDEITLTITNSTPQSDDNNASSTLTR